MWLEDCRRAFAGLTSERLREQVARAASEEAKTAVQPDDLIDFQVGGKGRERFSRMYRCCSLVLLPAVEDGTLDVGQPFMRPAGLGLIAADDKLVRFPKRQVLKNRKGMSQLEVEDEVTSGEAAGRGTGASANARWLCHCQLLGGVAGPPCPGPCSSYHSPWREPGPSSAAAFTS